MCHFRIIITLIALEAVTASDYGFLTFSMYYISKITYFWVILTQPPDIIIITQKWVMLSRGDADWITQKFMLKEYVNCVKSEASQLINLL